MTQYLDKLAAHINLAALAVLGRADLSRDNFFARG
jgi:hypothetical protein